MTTVLAVSPHLDDAVFSAGGALALLAAGGASVVVATVFTATVEHPQGFALACQLDKALGPEVDYMALRREEDARSCALLGAETRHLPFREAPHRGYRSAAELFAGLRPDDAVVAALAPALAALLDDLAPALVLAPQAVGGHVDHVAVVRALDTATRGTPVAWWRDHPYTIRTDTPAEPFGSRFLQTPQVELDCSGAAHAAKVRAALAYDSQLGFQFGGADKAREVFETATSLERLRAEPQAAEILERLTPLHART